MCHVFKLLPLTSLHRCLQGHSMTIKTERTQRTQLNVRSKNPRLGVVTERINYLCGNSWGESSRFEARPTEAVYTERKVRGHASKHVVGARLQSLRAGHQGWEWLEIYYSFSAKSCSLPCINDRGSMFKTSKHKYRRAAYSTGNNTWILTKYSFAVTSQRPKDCVCLAIDWPPSEGPHHSLSCSYVSSSSIHLHLSTALLGLISSMAPLVYILVNPFITLHVG